MRTGCWRDYEEVPIRTHVFSLAHKRTRECLRQERCAVLERAGVE